MAKKEKLNVKVITAPNGYVLDIGSHGFFYFTLEELLKGFIYHVGFKELGEVPVMPGAPAMLETLKEAGIERVLVTGSREPP